ncbi:T9SS type A sorting domain-containing protein [Flavobacterium sp.]|uniref:T9SS type A sorting domain-containing protein n=1 Tax=Flavobacterium sp. TaxID=239 RepID=UPI00375076F6
MKKLITFFVFMLSFVGISQNIGLDTSFGNNGVFFNTSIVTLPKAIFYENNKYIFLFNDGLSSINYNGTNDTSFGTNGKLFFNNSTETFLTKGAKIYNGFVYIFGQVSSNANSTNKNIFIAKISTSGVFDTTFGQNGLVKLDLGTNNEIINDIVINTDGKLLTIGNKDNLIFVTKIDTNGILDVSFNNVGFKSFPLNAGEISIGASIYNYLGNYILVGSTTQALKHLVFLNIDATGNLISTYGTNGIKTVTLSSPGETGGYSIVNSKIISDNIYIVYYFSWSFNNQYNRLVKYNLASDVYTTLNYVPLFSFDYTFDSDENIYTTGINRCSPATSSNCNRNYSITKLLPTGVLDTSFSSTGNYEYNFFPGDLISDDQSSILYQHSDGKKVVAGYIFNPYSPLGTGTTGFSVIRVMNSALSSTNFDIDSAFSLSPNPAEKELNISIKQDINISKIDIIDINGRAFISQNSDFEKVNVENLQQGIYFLKISYDDKNEILKFLKK